MDLIVGLPEEDTQLVTDSIEKVINLKPHNITAHTLAIKTASKLRKLEVRLPTPIEISKMHIAANKILRDKGYKPYYLYRQKRILGDMENSGYSLDGEESWYNVMIMEERQTIIGFGAGAASKFINKDNYEIHGVYYNPKDSIIYEQRQNLIKDKINLLCSLLKEEKRWQ
jgi:oxygen-independent coproporphyrinogen-3 oxidase